MSTKSKVLLGILLPFTIIGGAGIGYGAYLLYKWNKTESIPVNASYYSFNTNKQITGFSQDVVANPYKLSRFNTLDLDDQQIAGDAIFSADVFNSWKCTKMSFALAKFHFSEFSDEIRSGYRLFYQCNLSSVTDLDLANADFASCANTDFPRKTSISISTAYQTFKSANLSRLTTLDLSGTRFGNSTSTIYSIDDGKAVCTAYETFAWVGFSNLATFKLFYTYFYAICNSTGNIYTAFHTFEYSTFSSLVYLTISAYFAADNMTSSGDVNTADHTFYHSFFANLTSLSIANANLCSYTSMTVSGTASTANHTFYDTVLLSLSSLSIPHNNTSNSTWTNTFDSSSSIPLYPTTGGTVHWSAYTPSTPNKPNGWTDVWFENWYWTSSY